MTVKHGMSKTREYRSWNHMRRRCFDTTAADYKNYGGRGVRVCARWEDFAAFFADMGPRPPGTSIDRIDVNGDYEPGNCRWATHTLQMRNKRLNKNNRIGARGVSWHAGQNKYYVRITLDYRVISVGYFGSLDAAIAARHAAEVKYWGVVQ